MYFRSHGNDQATLEHVVVPRGLIIMIISLPHRRPEATGDGRCSEEAEEATITDGGAARPVGPHSILAVGPDFHHSARLVPAVGMVGALILDGHMVPHMKAWESLGRGIVSAKQGGVASGQGCLTLLGGK